MPLLIHLDFVGFCLFVKFNPFLGNTLCFISVNMFIKVSPFLFGLENGVWFNFVVKSVFCSSVKKLSNFSLVFDSMSMYFAVLLLRNESLEYV